MKKADIRPRSGRAKFTTVLIGVTGLHQLAFFVSATGGFRLLHAPRPALWGALLAGGLFALFFGRVRNMFPDRPQPAWRVHLVDEPYFVHWSASFGAAPFVLLASVAVALWNATHAGGPVELTTVAACIYLAFFLLALWGVFVRRRWVVVRHVDVTIPGLPSSFDGYRIAQLSDLHIGSLTPRRWGEAWARKSNREAPDLVAVTGDLVTSGVSFHQDIADVVGQLRAPDGVVVTMGNHDYFGDGEPLITLLRNTGAKVLRNEGFVLRRGEGGIYVAGVDDTWTRRANLDAALAERPPGMVTVLLAHDPDLFPLAAKRGTELVLSGHTHGGQIAVPFLSSTLTLSRLAHRFHFGLYKLEQSLLYVHPGLGTTGPPVRLGIPPEITMLRLRPGQRPRSHSSHTVS